MLIKEIGCCSAYCKTCIKWQIEKHPEERTCRGCKLGYESSERDINRAKCRIKVCCFKERGLETCADCPDYPCEILKEYWSKRGWKYKQVRKALEFIRKNGYDEFLKIADKWKGPYGKLEVEKS